MRDLPPRLLYIPVCALAQASLYLSYGISYSYPHHQMWITAL
jgi:hypothetical protein